MELPIALLKVNAPDGWIDRSTAVFLMPPRPLDPRLTQRSEASPGNISVRYVTVTPMSAEEYLTSQEAVFRLAGEGYSVTARGEIDGMAYLHARFAQRGEALGHVVCVRNVGPVHVIVVGTALLPFLNEIREAAVKCARSITLA